MANLSTLEKERLNGLTAATQKIGLGTHLLQAQTDIDAIEANVDQDVSSGAAPTLLGTNITAIPTAGFLAVANTSIGAVFHVMKTTSGGAGGNNDVALPTGTWDLIDVWGKMNGAGDTSDTIKITDGANDITNAIDASGADNTRLNWTTFDDTHAKGLIGGADILRAVQVDNSGSDAPAIDVHYLLRKVA